MKKYFILAAAAVVAFAACSKNSIETTSQEDRVINFSTVTGKATKAPIIGTTYSYNLPSFGVFAFYLSEGDWNTAAANTGAVAYMGSYGDGDPTPTSSLENPVEIKFNDDIDIWAPWASSKFVNYYWPLLGKLTFIAYSPFSEATATFSNAGVLTLTEFTVNTTVASQVDLLYSAVNANKTNNESPYTDTPNSRNSGTTNGVSIQFKHALAQVIFKAKTATEVYDAGLSFKINSIVVNAATTATSMTVTNPAVDTAPAAITTWNAPQTKNDFTVSSTFPAAANTYLNKTLSDAIGDPLLMIPITEFDSTEPATDGLDPYVTINYTLYRMSDNQNLGTKSVTVHFDVVDNIITGWQAGKKYEYDLTIDLEKIYFTPSIIDWTTGEIQGINIPENTPYNPAA